MAPRGNQHKFALGNSHATPKAAQGVPKIAPWGPMMPPRCPQDRPMGTHDVPRCPQVPLRGAHDLPKSYQNFAKTNSGHRHVAPNARCSHNVHLREREICSEVTLSATNSEQMTHSSQRVAFHNQFYTVHVHSGRCCQKH